MRASPSTSGRRASRASRSSSGRCAPRRTSRTARSPAEDPGRRVRSPRVARAPRHAGRAPARPTSGLALAAVIHAELLELAGEGIAAPAEKSRGLLAMAPRALERRADQHALELGLRVIEERPLGCERAPIGPALERSGPVGVLGRTRRGAGELLREVAQEIGRASCRERV